MLHRLLKIIGLFAEYSLFYRALSQKRPIILRSLLIVITPYWMQSFDHVTFVAWLCVCHTYLSLVDHNRETQAYYAYIYVTHTRSCHTYMYVTHTQSCHTYTYVTHTQSCHVDPQRSHVRSTRFQDGMSIIHAYHTHEINSELYQNTHSHIHI